MKRSAANSLDAFHGPVREWFEGVFPAPTPPQILGWPAIARGDSTLILLLPGNNHTPAAWMMMRAPPQILFPARVTSNERYRVTSDERRRCRWPLGR